MPPDREARCKHCGKSGARDDYRRAFGVRVCSACSSDDACPSAALITKTTAKSRFHVTDMDLDALGSLERANPHRPSWAPVKLYLVEQVEAIAHAKWGGANGLARRRRACVEARVTRAQGVTAPSVDETPAAKRRRRDGGDGDDENVARLAPRAVGALAISSENGGAAADDEGEL
mmetsp:Transcript_109/g.221  ORF Transcript_109/g.221 Transcript_109/m.221 type:complete len:175 (-) Transcript_109:67-591(-)|eukprot:CAMPEP_0198707970 /NCGR_PEP_ID=MMETSP1471-20131121/782_1 /TAXON_ID=41880 /ORGANISM="Pycnococcus provasolii, Strain RCC733" /LENGTH=174 /DNA_ID=CAMNT_0044467143 /DNA_START=20 /DNA_END=544 /DNA_ORIENTATION=-